VTTTDNYADAVFHRLAELVHPGVRWQRSLWNTGLVLCLKEIIEASDAVQSGALSSKAVKWLADYAQGLVARDPGVGSDQERKNISILLTRDLSSGGANYLELTRWIVEIEHGYCSRWASAVSQQERPSREHASRALGSHLLDRGHSPKALSRWLESLTIEDAGELFRQASVFARSPLLTFEAMLLFEKPPPGRIARPPEWKDASEVGEWLAENGFGRRRQHGGLLLSLDARDPFGAAAQAADISDRVLARLSVGTRGTASMGGWAYISGLRDPIPLRRTRRVEVRALEREARLLHLDRTGPVDDALELLSHLNSAPAPVAATAGWAAIESLLSGPGDADKVITAERLAYLVACSWPRAELTTLAWARAHQVAGDQLSADLRACATNRDRCDLFLKQVVEGAAPHLEEVRDRLGVRRVEKLNHDPRALLRGVQRQAAASLRRLYRQRNLVVHGGQIAGEALSATLRTSAPIVGAGLDRITQAAVTQQAAPLDLTARAKMEVERAGASAGPSLTGLLE
jgi:hypothetical protein